MLDPRPGQDTSVFPEPTSDHSFYLNFLLGKIPVLGPWFRSERDLRPENVPQKIASSITDLGTIVLAAIWIMYGMELTRDENTGKPPLCDDVTLCWRFTLIMYTCTKLPYTFLGNFIHTGLRTIKEDILLTQTHSTSQKHQPSFNRYSAADGALPPEITHRSGGRHYGTFNPALTRTGQTNTKASNHGKRALSDSALDDMETLSKSDLDMLSSGDDSYNGSTNSEDFESLDAGSTSLRRPPSRTATLASAFTSARIFLINTDRYWNRPIKQALKELNLVLQASAAAAILAQLPHAIFMDAKLPLQLIIVPLITWLFTSITNALFYLLTDSIAYSYYHCKYGKTFHDSDAFINGPFPYLFSFEKKRDVYLGHCLLVGILFRKNHPFGFPIPENNKQKATALVIQSAILAVITIWIVFGLDIVSDRSASDNPIHLINNTARWWSFGLIMYTTMQLLTAISDFLNVRLIKNTALDKETRANPRELTLLRIMREFHSICVCLLASIILIHNPFRKILDVSNETLQFLLLSGAIWSLYSVLTPAFYGLANIIAWLGASICHPRRKVSETLITPRMGDSGFASIDLDDSNDELFPQTGQNSPHGSHTGPTPSDGGSPSSTLRQFV